MAFTVPKIRIDAAALKKGAFGNSWRSWRLIAAAFLALYAVEAGYFTGLLFASEAIRGTDYTRVTSRGGFFGDFERAYLAARLAADNDTELPFNRPQGCVQATRAADVAGVPVTEAAPTQVCTGDAWTIFPWVAAAARQGELPAARGCAAVDPATVLLQGTTAYSGDASAEEPDPAAACQNFQPVVLPAAAAAAAAAPAPAP